MPGPPRAARCRGCRAPSARASPPDSYQNVVAPPRRLVLCGRPQARRRFGRPGRARLRRMRIAVVGAGVSGLTCGVRLLEEGARVSIVAREPPARTTSAVAGAVWFPYRVRPNERTGPWGRAGYERFERLSREDGVPVTMVELTALYTDPLTEEPWWLSAVPGEGAPTPRPAPLPHRGTPGRPVRGPRLQAPAPP